MCWPFRPALLRKRSEIDTVLLAAPPNMKDAATVIKWKADFTYDTLKKGTNRMVCYDLSGQPAHPPFTVECTSIANLDRVAQNLKFEAMRQGRKQGGLRCGREGRNPGEARIRIGMDPLHGPRPGARSTHTTVALPGATQQSLGMPDNPKQGGVWIMNAGTSTAHLMTPGS